MPIIEKQKITESKTWGVEKALEQTAKAFVPHRRWLSFFDRQLAHDLNKTLTADGNHIDLSTGSNSITVLENQNTKRINPNIRASANDAFSDGVKEALDQTSKSLEAFGFQKHTTEEFAKCSQHCKAPGRTACVVCHGQSFAAYKKALEGAITKAVAARLAKSA